MEFEFDPKKSEHNGQKHGIDFVEAQALWLDGNRLLVPAKMKDEERWMIIAMAKSKLWSGIFTARKGKVRIISVRRARRDEKEFYEG